MGTGDDITRAHWGALKFGWKGGSWGGAGESARGSRAKVDAIFVGVRRGQASFGSSWGPGSWGWKRCHQTRWLWGSGLLWQMLVCVREHQLSGEGLTRSRQGVSTQNKQGN